MTIQSEHEGWELAPCPWCGKRPAYDHTRADGVRFSCLECEEATFEDFAAAAAFWNNRRSPPVSGGGPSPDLVLVPRKPTEEMCAAFLEAEEASIMMDPFGAFEDAYRAILSALPAGGGGGDKGSSRGAEQGARASTLPLGQDQHSAGWEPFTIAEERFLDPGAEVLVRFKVQRGARNDYRGLYYILGDDPLEDPTEGTAETQRPAILTSRVVAIRRPS